MPLDLTSDCTFTGPALPEPFVKFNLEAELNRLALLPKATGAEGRALDDHWQFVRRKLRNLVAHGGGLRVQNHVIEPLLAQLGYARIEAVEAVQTREGDEDGGALLSTEDGAAKLRVWCVDLDADLDAPARRGLAYRFSHTRIAQRVLLATGERLGILTNGLELRLIISDPARLDSEIAISIDPHWKRSRDLPDSVRLFIALASPAGVKALPELIDKARLQQAKVTKDLREQARSAIREFIQELLDHPENQEILKSLTLNPQPSTLNQHDLARALWHEGLITVYRLLFILKLESTDDPARSFSFASTSLWRSTFSPSVALAPIVRRVLDHGAQTGRLLQDGLRALFRMLSDGLQCTELNVRPMAGALFAPATTPVLGRLEWTETAIAKLLDNLLWTRSGRGATARERVHYGPLDVEDLGRVYEALLELEPGIAAEPMCRLRRAKLEVVVPAAQGERYKPVAPPSPPSEGGEGRGEVGRLKSEIRNPKSEIADLSLSAEDDHEPEEDGEATAAGSKKTKVEWIEEIPPGRFYLRVGLGRKATGSFYTPHSFVRFLVHETLGPLVARCVSPLGGGAHAPRVPCSAPSPNTPTAGSPSPPSEGGEGRGEVGAPTSTVQQPEFLPDPRAILKLKVIDKAMGSGHFLVESCRFLGEALYDAARRCDELAASAEKLAESYRASANTKPEHQALATEQAARAATLRQRVLDLPDPDDELLRYLPSRSVEGAAGGVSHNKALALCRRMVAVHCLYGVDKNPLAVELAKLALWIECHAEGLPLTFLDHRLVVGDSLTGPFFEHLVKYPGSQQPLNDLFTQGLTAKLTTALADALQHVRALEATVGVTVADINAKQAAKTRLDRALAPFKILAAAWSGGVMLGPEGCDDTAYAALAKLVADTGQLPEDWLTAIGQRATGKLLRMIVTGLGLPAIPADDADIQSMVARLSANAVPALSFDLAFPEVFYPDANPANRVGFDADLGNPPWDAIQFKSKEFFAAFDFEILNASSGREREAIERRLLTDESCSQLFEEHSGSFEHIKRANDALYSFQKVYIDGDLAGRQLDAFRVFMERANQILRHGGLTGVVVPSAFHANEGATGIRRLYFEQMSMHCCFSFENKRKLFEIHSSFKFATVVAEKGTITSEFLCAFYLHDDEWLFTDRKAAALRYDSTFVHAANPKYLALLELRNPVDAEIATTIARSETRFGAFLTQQTITFGREFDVGAKEPWIGPPSNFLPIIEGKNFHQFQDVWDTKPSASLILQRFGAPRKAWRFFRTSFRRVASSTNERTSIWAILPPGVVGADSNPIETTPDRRPNTVVLSAIALLNSFPFDFQLRQRVGANVNPFILESCSIPALQPIGQPLLIHSALRLTCNHAGYAPLWREQLGEAWREAGAAFTWPVLSGDDARWAVRAAIDAVVAHAYGLTRDQYAHVLSTFSHSSYKDAPRQCLAAFDQLQQIGFAAFTKKHDPYWNIPLNENMPEPVIDLRIPAAAPGEAKRPRNADLFDFKTAAAPAGSGTLFAELPVVPPRAKRRRSNERR